MAMSPRLCATVSFSPPLSMERRMLQDEMVSGGCIKNVVVYRTPFWLQPRVRKHGLDPHVTELGPVHNLFHSSVRGMPALVGLTTGKHAWHQSTRRTM
eukprot:CAMPEP_0173409396 /NCGR_PEP_ID=MMETSP1356-20130122/72044_1 /TAXON_ID=77927 ORGANISM="Hemiselmis virescens, Strain PCC157" /NCGR_SAMPLE_ID=MMETSP1356 /ASSEMBLY_ACC=CAM_ASM_000847 /LENGTH=97 /DNA_ID=CAMNT_0014370851 /DNA_START=84 /DNA_END=374 /DNA_ORIENTATION=+